MGKATPVIGRFEALPGSANLTVSPLCPDLRVDDALRRAAPCNREHWVAFAPGDAFVHPQFVEVVAMAARRRPDVDLFYADDVALGVVAAERLRRKPAWNPELLIAQDFVGAPLIMNGVALSRLGGLDSRRGPAALYDAVLRAADVGLTVAHLSEVLIAYPGGRPVVDRDRRRAVIEACLASAGPGRTTISPGLTPTTLLQRRVFDPHPHVTPAHFHATEPFKQRRRCRKASGQAGVEPLADGAA